MNNKYTVSQEKANEVGQKWETIAVSGTSAGRAKKLHRAWGDTSLCQHLLNNCNGNGSPPNLRVKDASCYPPGYRDFCRVCGYLSINIDEALE